MKLKKKEKDQCLQMDKKYLTNYNNKCIIELN